MKTGNKKYRLLLENLPDAFAYHRIITDGKGKPVDYTFLDVNRAFEKMTGLSRGKITGKKVSEVLPDFVGSGFDWIGTYGRVALTGESTCIEQYSELLGRWYAVTAYSDAPGYFAVLFHDITSEHVDITDRKEAERKLQENERKYVEAFNLVTGILESSKKIVIFALDQEYRYLTFNTNHQKTMKHLWDVEIEIGKNMLDYITDPVDREKAKTNFDRALKGETFTIIEQYGDTALDRRWYEDVYNPLYDADGNVIGLTLFLFDITDRKQAEESLNYRIRFEKMVSEISSKFINLPSQAIDQGINYALKLTGELFEVDRSYVFQFSADGQFMSNTHEWCAAGIEPQMDKVQKQPLKSLPWWAKRIRAHDYVHIPDVDKLPPEAAAEREEFQRQGIQSLLSVPLRSKNSLIGLFGFDAVTTKMTWTEETISFLRVIADILANAMERNKAEQKILAYTMELEQKGIEIEKLYQQLDKELDKARAIHERTLPEETPEIAGLSLQAYYQPAQRMGGDYFNTIQADNKLILYVSDVSGHGLEGTLLSAFVRATIDSYASLKPQEIEPGRILEHLNRQYRLEDYPADYFICIFLMVLDLHSMELTYTGAGFQELPLVQRGSGERLRLQSEGLPISAAIPEELMDYTEGKIRLTPGTSVLVSTDGLTEQQAGKELYNGRLEQVFYEHSHLPPEIILSAVKEDFYRFNGGSLQGDDDITLGIIQAEPEEKQELCLELESSVDTLASLREEVLKFIPDTETADILCMGLHELAANAMEHGNKFDPQKKVTVVLAAMAASVYASIKDEGPGFDWMKRKNNPLVLDAASERGRGIAMTQVCAGNRGKLYYNDKGNRAYYVVERCHQGP